LVPAGEMAKANPMRVAAVRADVDRAGFGAVDVAAGVSCHGRRLSIHVGGTEMVPLSQGFVLPDKEKVVLPPAPFRTVVHRAVFGTYPPVAHSLK
jgi:hypothetical protein